MFDALQIAFTQIQDPAKAKKQSAYLKDKFSCYGISSPDRKEIQKRLFKAHPISSYEELIALVRKLFSQEQREMHYTGIDLVTRYKKLLPKEGLSFIEELITTNSWWDSVDAIASNILGGFLKTYPEQISQMDQWIAHPHLWLRRSALIYQLKYKEQTDVQRLFRYIESTAHEKEFFIRKAIGWALREVSKKNPKAVIGFLKKQSEKLSPLSKREASKYLN